MDQTQKQFQALIHNPMQKEQYLSLSGLGGKGVENLKKLWDLASTQPYNGQMVIEGLINLKRSQKRIFLPVSKCISYFFKKIRLKNCKYDDCVYDLREIIKGVDKINFTCRKCSIKVTDEKDLMLHSFYQTIINQLNEITEECFYYRGLVFLKHPNKQTSIEKAKCSNGEKLIVRLFNEEKQRNEANSFSKIFTKNREFYDDMITFEAICLLKSTKLILPVRHKQCNHLEAYDLENLLTLFYENQNKTTKESTIQCHQCNSRFGVNNLDQLSKDIYLDLELLRAINLAYNFSTTFLIDSQTGKLEDYFMNSNREDEYVRTLHGNQPDLKKKQFEVLQSLAHLYSRQQNKKSISFEQSFQYKSYSVDLVDPFVLTQTNVSLPILYPARCYNCKTKNCCDVRSYIYLFEATKYKSSIFGSNFNCPICESPIGNSTFNSQIYIDENLRQRIFDGLSWKINIDGKSELLAYFKNKNKITKQRRSQINWNGIFYKTILCLETNKKLENPLTIIQCPFQSMISFEAFFKKFEENGHKVEGLRFCKCSDCIDRPLNSIETDLSYEEFLASHLPSLPNSAASYKWNEQKQVFEQVLNHLYEYRQLNQQPQKIQQYQQQQQKVQYTDAEMQQMKEGNLTYIFLIIIHSELGLETTQIKQFETSNFVNNENDKLDSFSKNQTSHYYMIDRQKYDIDPFALGDQNAKQNLKSSRIIIIRRETIE